MANVKTLTVNNVTYTIVDSTAVHKSGDETSIAGHKGFTGQVDIKNLHLPKTDNDKDGGEMIFEGANNEPNAAKTISIDRYDGKIRIFGQNSSGTKNTVLQADIQNNQLLGPSARPGVSDNSQRVVTTAFIQDKFKYSEKNPSTKSAGVIYFVKE